MVISARNITALGQAFTPCAVNGKDGLNLPRVEPDAVKLLPVAQPGFVNDGRAKPLRPQVVDLDEQSPNPAALIRELWQVKLRRAPAGALLDGLQVLAQGFAIVLLLVEMKVGLRVVYKRLGQALIKRVWSFMAAASCFTSHSRFGSE